MAGYLRSSTTATEAWTVTFEVFSAVWFCGHSWGLDIEAAGGEHTTAKRPAEEAAGNVAGK